MFPLFAGVIAAAGGYEQFHTLICRWALVAERDDGRGDGRPGPPMCVHLIGLDAAALLLVGARRTSACSGRLDSAGAGCLAFWVWICGATSTC
jgi:hypothetical protein